MAARLAACDPCRRAKVACDHGQPICARCKKRSTDPQCIYRASPFKRARYVRHSPASDPSSRSSQPVPQPLADGALLQRNPYPNPGYLGPSSHVAIFNYISPTEAIPVENEPSDFVLSAQTQADLGELVGPGRFVDQTARTLERLLAEFDSASLEGLVKFWLARGVNLALAGPVVESCMESTTQLWATPSQDRSHYKVMIRRLLQQSAHPLTFTKTSTLSNYINQFCGRSVRCETVGIFLSAVVRASIDVPFFPPLYTTETERRRFCHIATALSSCALELCLALDCLNDLQLIFQYEHWIVLSYVYGDQSHCAWRKLGDVVTSIFALGYHTNVDDKLDVPPFLINLRKTVFARTYSGDKNVAIFLGRPPRMSKKFAYFQIPCNRQNPEGGVCAQHDIGGCQVWDSRCEMSYAAETCWSALCAYLKEEILELLYGEHRQESEAISNIARQMEELWEALPTHFRLVDSLKHCNKTPFQCDFLLSTRLNYLHVKFLLRFATLDYQASFDRAFIDIAQEILSLVVEGIVLRERLANSGTGLIWKIAHYGLPAAGILLLDELRHSDKGCFVWRSRRRIWQDFTILAAEVQAGSVVREGDANYALLYKAAQTIQRFLDFNADDESCRINPEVTVEEASPSDDWLAFLNPDPWSLEIGFWDSLDKYSLSGANTAFSGI